MDTDQIQETLHSINQTGNKMTSIINELLLLASVRKMQQVEIGPLDMERIILEAQRRLVDIITEYRAKIRSPETWPAAIGYGPWVEEVWANYISNALKYGGKPPAIELGFDKQNLSPDQHAGMIDNQPAQNDSSTGKEYIRFWVRDNGNGLTPKEQSKLFVEFTRLEQARAQGHGLGLSIVRRIVEKLGGQVGVESLPGAGSKFYFTLPKADEEIEPTPETIIDPDET
jgi:two-component system sensor histidine kinase/response regulator